MYNIATRVARSANTAFALAISTLFNLYRWQMFAINNSINSQA
jgi:hypothetical protein